MGLHTELQMLSHLFLQDALGLRHNYTIAEKKPANLTTARAEFNSTPQAFIENII